MKKIGIVILLVLCFWFSRSLCAQANISPATAELLKTASYADVVQMQQLLDQGADVNARDSDGYTPLDMAAQYGNVSTVKLLLDKGAQVDNAAFATRGSSPTARRVRTPWSRYSR